MVVSYCKYLCVSVSWNQPRRLSQQVVAPRAKSADTTHRMYEALRRSPRTQPTPSARERERERECVCAHTTQNVCGTAHHSLTHDKYGLWKLPIPIILWTMDPGMVNTGGDSSKEQGFPPNIAKLQGPLYHPSTRIWGHDIMPNAGSMAYRRGFPYTTTECALCMHIKQ